MNRWWGNSDDSDKQSADRSSRFARRRLRAQAAAANTIASDEEPFLDAEASFNAGLNLDGDDDTMEAAELARQRKLPVSEANFDDDSEAWKKEIKLKFEPHDVPYWINSIESQMRKFGINSQWSKETPLLPSYLTMS